MSQKEALTARSEEYNFTYNNMREQQLNNQAGFKHQTLWRVCIISLQENIFLVSDEFWWVLACLAKIVSTFGSHQAL